MEIYPNYKYTFGSCYFWILLIALSVSLLTHIPVSLACLGRRQHARQQQDATLGWQQSAAVSQLQQSPANLGRAQRSTIEHRRFEQLQDLFPASCSNGGGGTLLSVRPAAVTAPFIPCFPMWRNGVAWRRERSLSLPPANETQRSTLAELLSPFNAEREFRRSQGFSDFLSVSFVDGGLGVATAGKNATSFFSRSPTALRGGDDGRVLKTSVRRRQRRGSARDVRLSSSRSAVAPTALTFFRPTAQQPSSVAECRCGAGFPITLPRSASRAGRSPGRHRAAATFPPPLFPDELTLADSTGEAGWRGWLLLRHLPDISSEPIQEVVSFAA
nr:hypothetical protein Iba_chr09eCG14590 [Ipomoea batatas]